MTGSYSRSYNGGVSNDSQKNVEELADQAIEQVLNSGQSVSIDGMAVSKANLRDAVYIRDKERQQAAIRSGARPLFRGINLSGVQ